MPIGDDPTARLMSAGVREVAEMNNPDTKPAAEASISELMTQLSSQTSRLVRDEMRLAQKEFVESAKHAGIGAGLFSAAGSGGIVWAGQLGHRRDRRAVAGGAGVGGALIVAWFCSLSPASRLW